MSKRNETYTGPALRAGFSLVVVLIVSLVGMAIIGVAFYIYESSVSQTGTALMRVQEYNALQSALEQGKNLLLEMVDNSDPMPRWYDNLPGTSSITDPDQLIIENGELDISDRVYGENVTIHVAIYDSFYDSSIVDSGMNARRLAEMPPAHRFEGGGMMQEMKPDEPGEDSSSSAHMANIGVYLIRAQMTVRGEVKKLETSVVQRNNL